ncbi:MAG: peroxiredoxin [Lentimonas sp.]|jgi:peroxiredoxin
MSLTFSKMLSLGTKLPEFELINSIDNQKLSSRSLSKNKGKVIMFICNHCPYVIHYHDQISDITNRYLPNIEFVAISSNDASSYKEDSPKKMKELAHRLNFQFPYLYDETQEIAQKYQAVCTPEFYFFDENNHLIYRGRLDDSSPNSEKQSTGNDLRNAIDNFLSKVEISNTQHPSMGCNIKWIE